MSAKFPTEAPVLYESKTTANDVSDTAHWDGADANAVKEEVLAIAAKVGIDGDENESSHDYKLAALDSRVTMVEGDVGDLDSRVTTLESRMIVTAGSGTLAASTSTVVSDSNVAAGSTIVVQPRSSAFTSLGVYVSAKSSGSFTLTHSSAAGTETFDYIVAN
jgi:hypothetical protein